MAALSRRSFLKTTAALAGMSAVGAAGAEGPKPSRKFTLALSCGAIGVQATPREAIELAPRFGFEAVEPSADFLRTLSDGELEKLLADMKAKRLAWGAAGLPVSLGGDDAALADGMKRLPELATALRRAGVTRIATWLSPTHRSMTYLANFRRHALRVREVAKVLGEHGLRLGLEYVAPKTSWTAGRFPFIHTMAEMKELIAEVGLGNVGFLLDSWHWYTAQETEADLLSLRAEDVVCCHLNDAPKGVPVAEQLDGRRELPCATGVIDVKTFLGALVKIGYDGPVLCEPMSRALRGMSRDEALATVAAAMKKAFALAE